MLLAAAAVTGVVAQSTQPVDVLANPDSDLTHLSSDARLPAVEPYPVPDNLENVGLEERLNNQLPLDAEFRDHNGVPVKLRQFFDGKRPVILTLNFFKCPMICGIQMEKLLETMKEMNLTAGSEFQIVTISFDPLETYQLAREKRKNYLAEYGRPPAGTGWQFLTGDSKNINAVLDACGWKISWVESRNEWAHPLALMVCTPDGKLSRYLRRLPYDEKTVRLSLVEAAAGKIGTTWDDVLLFCFHYDASQGQYMFAARTAMSIGGLMTLLGLCSFVFYWSRRGVHLPQPEKR